MLKPYSLDLRQTVVNAVKQDGMKKGEASVSCEVQIMRTVPLRFSMDSPAISMMKLLK